MIKNFLQNIFSKKDQKIKDILDLESCIEDLDKMHSESTLPEKIIDFIFDEKNLNESYDIPKISDFFIRVSFYYKKPGDIIRVIERRRKKFGQNDNDARFLAHASVRQKNYRFSIDLFHDVFEKGIYGSFDLINYAACLSILGQFEKAINILEIHDQQFRSNKESLWERSKILYLMGNYKEALNVTGKLIDEIKNKHWKNANHLRWLHVYILGLLGKSNRGLEKQKLALLERNKIQKQVLAKNIIIGILDYKGPDFSACSMNIGDTMQSVAMLRQISRYWSTTCVSSHPDLDSSLKTLKRTWSEKNEDDLGKDFGVKVVDRDCYHTINTRRNNKDEIKKIWIFYHGWYLHKHFERQLAFPLPENAKPIFISFYLHRLDDLTEEVVSYLKKYEPIGCRDWDTTYVLINQGIKAFFSGCITTTLKWEVSEGKKSNINVDYNGFTEQTDIESLKNNVPQFRTLNFPAAVKICLENLSLYKNAKNINTSRLHCYLPCKAIGSEVNFYPKEMADRRFSGLYPASDDELNNISERIDKLLDTMLRKIIGGFPEEEIYRTWREHTDKFYREAINKYKEFPGNLIDSINIDIPLAINPIRFKQKKYILGNRNSNSGPDDIWVVLSFDDNLTEYLPVLIRSILANTKSNINFVLLTRGVDRRKVEKITEKAPDCSFRVFEMDGLLRGINIGLAPLTTISTMDRIFTPLLLPDIDKVVYLDIDTIVLGDIAELIKFEVSNRGIAARPTPNHHWSYQFNVIQRRSLGFSTEKISILQKISIQHVRSDGTIF